MSDKSKQPSDCDIRTTLAELSVAEQALREEPYERLPALAGMLAIAAWQIEQLRAVGRTTRVLEQKHREAVEVAKILCQYIDAIPKSIEYNVSVINEIKPWIEQALINCEKPNP